MARSALIDGLKMHIHVLVNVPVPWQHPHTVQPSVFLLHHCSRLELKLADGNPSGLMPSNSIGAEVKIADCLT